MKLRSLHWGIWTTAGLTTFAVMEYIALKDEKPFNTLTGRVRRFRNSGPLARAAVAVTLGGLHGWLVDHFLNDDGSLDPEDVTR